MLYFVAFSFLALGLSEGPKRDLKVTHLASPIDTLPAKIDIARLPLGLEGEREIPKDNPLNDKGVQLGRKLFFDPLLSANGKVSCATCHRPDHGFASPEPRSIGIEGRIGRRNAPSLLNRAFSKSLFWDGRMESLEQQSLKPIEDHNEMGSSMDDVLRKLQTDENYRKAFGALYSDGVTAGNLGKALASFERTLLLGDTSIDRFRSSEVAELSAEERHGLWLFESKGKCWQCHSGHNFTDEAFHNTGVSWAVEPLDLGRFEHTKKEKDKGRFKTPTLRGVGLTAPYMHDGSLKTLEDVLEFYSKGGKSNPYLDKKMEPLNFSKQEIADMTAFLNALSKPVPNGDRPAAKPEKKTN